MSNNGSEMPITSLQLEIDKPCMDSYFFQSGLANADNSIYQNYDFNYFNEGQDYIEGEAL